LKEDQSNEARGEAAGESPPAPRRTPPRRGRFWLGVAMVVGAAFYFILRRLG
jgi:hypothetical protein